MNFTKKKQKLRITDLAAWKRYVRSFLRVAGSLLRNTKLTEEEHATYFWKGIPRIMRIRLENRLLAADPARNLSTPFSVNEINGAAEALLQRDRFDNMMGDSDSDDDSVREEWSSGSESSDSESDSDDDTRKRQKAKKRKSAKKYYASDSEEDVKINKKRSKSDSPKRRIISGKSEVEGLIRQLNSMSNDDPGYGLTFFKAVKLDKDVDRVVRAPSFKISPVQVQQFPGASYRRPNTYVPPPRPSANIFQAQPPPHLSAANSYPLRPPPTGMPPREGITCYGCGEPGHGMSNCPKLNEYIQQGILMRDNAGRIVKQDGSGIRRFGTETFVDAIERERRPQSQSHLITIDGESSDNNDDTEYESDSLDIFNIDYEDVYVIENDKYQTYAADRGEKKITAKRKEVMDGVYPPPLKRQSDRLKERENRPTPKPVARPIRPTAKDQQQSAPTQPKAREIPRKESQRVDKSNNTPLASQNPRFNPDDDEDMIDDFNRDTRAPLERKENNVSSETRIQSTDRKTVPRRSAVSAHVDPMNIMNQLLNTRVSLAVGEVLGVSRELSGMLSDSIKLKSGKSPAVPAVLAASFRPKTRGLLIKIQIECNGMPIEAIIDTGSQLNIVSEAICKSKVKRPVDHSSTVNMNDANGGERTLQGLVKNVPLNCGGVHTEVNLYVGEHVPFQMLLGRPWQRGNFVSIDERKDGTYLLFKDPATLENRHEILVTPDNTASVDWEFEPSTWQVSDAPTSYFIEIPTHPKAEEKMTHRVNHNKGHHNKGHLRDTSTSYLIKTPMHPKAEEEMTHRVNHSKGHLRVETTMRSPCETPRNQSGINKQVKFTPIWELYPAFMDWLSKVSLKQYSPIVVPKENAEGAQKAIKERRIYKEGHSQHIETLSPPAEMSLNPALPISNYMADLPAIYSSAQPRPEAADIRDALLHEKFMHDNDCFSDITIHSSQAFVTGYHIDSQGNNYTAITGLRGVRTVMTGNGPQTMYGHYVARFYTDLDPIPSTPDSFLSHDIVNKTESLCSNCHKSHSPIVSCNSRTNYSLVRVTSNGSIQSSIMLDDNHSMATDPVSTSPTRLGNYSHETLLYPSDSTDSPISPKLAKSPTLQLLGNTLSAEVRNGVSIELDQAVTSYQGQDLTTYAPSQADSGDGEELDQGIRSLWKVYEEQLTDEEKEKEWGRSPYEIIMALDLMKVKELANIVTSREISSILAGKDFICWFHQNQDLTRDALDLASQSNNSVSIMINDAATTKPLPEIPDLFPFTRAAASLQKPSICSPISNPEPVSVYSARIASSFHISQSPSSIITPTQVAQLRDILKQEPKDENHHLELTCKQWEGTRENGNQSTPTNSPTSSFPDGSKLPTLTSERSILPTPTIIIPPPRPTLTIKKPMTKDPRKAPLEYRDYLPEHDYGPGVIRPRMGRIFAIDIRTCHPISGFEDPPIAEVYIRFVTNLCGAFEPYIFPDVIHNSPPGPYDLPPVRARKWGERINEIYGARNDIHELRGQVESSLTPAQITELNRININMFTTNTKNSLVDSTIDREYFFRKLHPVYNPLVTKSEATFLRGACYHFRRLQQHVLANSIDVLLCTPHYDDYYCRQLLELGCLDHHTTFQRQRACAYIKRHEDRAIDDTDSSDEEDSDELDDGSGEDMDVETDYDEENEEND